MLKNKSKFELIYLNLILRGDLFEIIFNINICGLFEKKSYQNNLCHIHKLFLTYFYRFSI